MRPRTKFVVLVGLSAALSLLDAPSALAGKEGHGGRIWACAQADGTTTYELLDYQLARADWKLSIDLGPGATEIEKIRYALARYARLEPSRAQVYLDRAEHFMDRVIWTDEEFINHGDFDKVIIKPKNCDLKLLVNQKRSKSERREETVFLITQGLWRMLDSTQKAGVILHEIAYEDAIEQGHESSDRAIYLNALIASSQVDSMDLQDLLEISKNETQMGYYYGDFLLYPELMLDTQGRIVVGKLKKTLSSDQNRMLIEGQALRLRADDEIQFYPDSSTPRFAFPDKVQTITIRGAKLPINSESAGHVETKIFKKTDFLLFHPNGMLKRATFTPIKSDDQDLPTVRVEGKIDLKVDTSHRQVFELNDQGDFTLFTSKSEFKIQKGDQMLRLGGVIIIDPQGQLISANLRKKVKLTTSQGLKKKFRAGDQLYFDPNGNVAVGGIYSRNPEEIDFIRIAYREDRVVFGQCSILHPEDCQILGRPEGYRRGDLEKNLDLTAFAKFSTLGWNIAGGVGMGALSLGLVIVFTVPNLAFGLMIGGWLLGNISGTVVENRSLPEAQKKEAVRLILNQGFLLVDAPISQIQRELEDSLAKIDGK